MLVTITADVAKERTFKPVQSMRFFRCKKVTYLWDEDSSLFYPLRGLDHNVDTATFHQQVRLRIFVAEFI